MKRIHLIFLAAAIAASSTIPNLGAAQVDDLAADLERDLGGNTTGFGYAIYLGTDEVKTGGGGVRVRPTSIFDSGLPFTANTVKDVHSMSKAITAAAVVQALEEQDRSCSSKIYDDLPAALQAVVVDDRVRDITYEQLLSHRSGFPGGSQYSWSQVKSVLSKPLEVEPGTDPPTYGNVNYALCRILLPYIIQPEYMRDLEAGLLGEGGLADLIKESVLDAVTSSRYRDYVQKKVFAKAGIVGATARPLADPEEDSSYNFSYRYNFHDRSASPRLMGDRRRTVGSGGWALSARQYARFIAFLFEGKIFTEPSDDGPLEHMTSGDLGMRKRTDHEGRIFYRHNGSGTGSNVGGRSYWVHYPAFELSVAIQVNCTNGTYAAAGLGLETVVLEAVQNAFSDTPATAKIYGSNVIFRRATDGRITTRGVRGSAAFASRNLEDDWTSGWTGFASFKNTMGAFALHYKADNGGGSGRAQMFRINEDGTFGTTVFNETNWRAGWTHLTFFEPTGGGHALLLYNRDDSRLRTFAMGSNGTLLTPALSNFQGAAGFDHLTVVRLAGEDHLLRYSSSTGRALLNRFDSDGAVGTLVSDKEWSPGFTDIHAYTSGGKSYLFRYSTNNGRARINRFVGTTLDAVPEVSDSIWHDGWDIIRFFRTGGDTYQFRYDPALGLARTQRIGADGDVTGDPDERTGLLRDRESSGAFDPGATGWTEIEFYPGGDAPSPEVAGFLPAPGETGTASLPGSQWKPAPVPPAPALGVTFFGDMAEVAWDSAPGRYDIVEFSTDLRTWAFGGYSTGLSPDGSAHSLARLRVPPSTPVFYTRIRSLPELPPDATPPEEPPSISPRLP